MCDIWYQASAGQQQYKACQIMHPAGFVAVSTRMQAERGSVIRADARLAQGGCKGVVVVVFVFVA
jgi:hypothetical protein